MPPPVILDPAQFISAEPIADRDEIMRQLPHRHEFQLLDGILLSQADPVLVVGYHEVREGAWWAKGHIPGRPLFPGVLMIEVAAQVCSYLTKVQLGMGGFLGFVGVEGVKFRGSVTPPARLVMVAKGKSVTRRRTVADVQGFVGTSMVFEGEITGMFI